MASRPPAKNEGGEGAWERHLSESVGAGMTRRQWYALLGVAVGLLWALALTAVIGLKLGPVPFF